MALERGGYADKLGNRFESRWIVRQLLMLLNERIQSVMLEPVGDDEGGVDLWVVHHDGRREAQQCKVENGANAFWKLADLKRRGVLKHLRNQLQRDSSFEYTLVSDSPAPQLRDLSRSAKDSTSCPESFYTDQILASGKHRADAFAEWCRLLDLRHDSVADRAIAFELLTRSGFHQHSDTRETREDLRLIASHSVNGEPDAVIASLADFAADNPRKTIVVTDVSRHLTNAGFELRGIFADERIEPRLAELWDDFEESVRPNFAGGKQISRPEVQEVLNAIDKEDKPANAIVVHGAAGHGKSGVLSLLAKQLRDRGTPVLAIRLDRRIPQGNPLQFGRLLGLPESPIKSLVRVSGNRNCVLILDQLDALRWTSSHSVDGLEVCKGLLRETHAARRLGARLSVVLSCRTFDLEHDPQIQTWLKPSTTFAVSKIEVKQLPESSLLEFVAAFGVDFSRMTKSRKSLLRSVQNLTIWANLVESEDSSPEFDSGTDLMREFWASRWRELERAGFSVAERESLLGALIDHMESNATLSAPGRMIATHQGLATELQTLHVIQTDRRTVSFCHQSYLDFLIANRVVTRLSCRTSAVRDWLGGRSEQSLFRREQLRQLLFLLADESPDQLTNAIDCLIASDDVRFHIKQVVIEAIGQLRPIAELVRRVVDLASDDEWRIHILHDVLYGGIEWLDAIHKCDLLVDWLVSSDTSRQNNAVWLLLSVANDHPVLISKALQESLVCEQDALMAPVLHYSEPQSEPDDVFRYRLERLGLEEDDPYIAWKKLADERPDRAVRLVARHLFNQRPGRRRQRNRDRLETDGSNDVRAIVRAARRRPKLTVRLLIPIALDTAARMRGQRMAWKNRMHSDEPAPYPQTRYSKILLRMLRAAVTVLARKSPECFQRLSDRLASTRSSRIQSILVRGWSSMPTSFADEAIRWLLADLRRLRCGSQKRKPRWYAAAALVEAMSSHCSCNIFDELEAALLKYRDPDEKRLGQGWLLDTRNGHFWNQFGAAQHFLLPALDEGRRSVETTGRIGVLNRKFSESTASFLRRGGVGGSVCSPIRSNDISRISDKQWLRLIGNRDIPDRDTRTWRHGPNGFIESSTEHFAQDFGIAAKREPERFAKLALRFPTDAPFAYIAEVLGALEQANPGTEVPKYQHDSWQPASREFIEEWLESIEIPDDEHVSLRLCWLIHHRDVHPSRQIIQRLIELTKYAHPRPDRLVIGCDKAASEVGIGELESNVLNSVRSMAVLAISSILYDHRDLLDEVRPALERRLKDDHPVVRAAIIQVCLPVWNTNRTLAVQWFLALAQSDLRLACSRAAQRFCNNAFPDYADQLTPLVESMCQSSIDDISAEGASEATARWLFYDIFVDLVAKCRNGSDAQRLGVTTIAARFVHDQKYAAKCWPILIQACDDPCSKVREQASRALHSERILEIPGYQSFLNRLLATRAFEDDPDCLIDAFQGYAGQLTPFAELIAALAMRAIEIIRDPDREPVRRLPLIDRHLTTVILRLYEQASGNAAVRDRCLDMIDEMLKRRVASALSLVDEIGG